MYEREREREKRERGERREREERREHAFEEDNCKNQARSRTAYQPRNLSSCVVLLMFGVSGPICSLNATAVSMMVNV